MNFFKKIIKNIKCTLKKKKKEVFLALSIMVLKKKIRKITIEIFIEFIISILKIIFNFKNSDGIEFLMH